MTTTGTIEATPRRRGCGRARRVRWRGRKTVLVVSFTTVVLGSVAALVRHMEARGHAAIRRGEGIVARWRLEAEAWRAFVEGERARGTLEAGEPRPPGTSRSSSAATAS